ncbi:S8 family serine peptidase [Halorussus gelatinilyticus]|uniref:S8 family serine peptidase n=1 Tax=Halorussus gelatinilyticus TaxID=2937524 RepID=A0A8U0II53_9EURY|nr:S8 family serine peptidase [Halorussus gelatinilyticus]UPW00777.1 S8 family serine peptidase [Halorussus gelatinilyticus]
MSDDSTQRFNRRTFLKATGAAGAAVAASGVTAATPGREPGPKKDEILVGVSAGRGDVEAQVSQHVPGNAEVVHSSKTLRYAAVKFPSKAPEHAKQNFIEAITKKDGIKYAEKNATHQAFATPNDPRFSDQYAPQQVESPAAWDEVSGYGDSGVTIAVVDTGAQYDHPDLEENYKSDPGKDFVDDDSDPRPPSPSDEKHGTHVSGCAAGVVNDSTGVAGQGNSSLINGRALGPNGGSTSDIADAIRWATDQGADIINMSLGGGGYSQTMKNAVQYAVNNGALPICAAGNDGSSSVSYPAGYSECMAISAVDSNEQLASFSQYGSKVDLCAPGVDVLSTVPTDSYAKFSGTSMATPVTSGVAGLTLAKHSSLGPSDLRSHLKATAKDIGLSSDKQGAGQVNALNAVTTQPGSGGGGDDGGSGDSTTSTASGTLSDSYDYDDYSYAWEYSSPSQVVVELSGPSGADFDLYVNTGTTSAATPSSYDYGSYTTDSQESITIDNPDTSTEMQIDVDSYSGSGDYTLTITEKK